ncbi:hypothetical protein M758_9G188500 [Ceratodon purpureus]|nr:hypothetical protein M758_9G188500 [Ceratodon purpureus]
MKGAPQWMYLGGNAELRSDEASFAGAWFEVTMGYFFTKARKAWVEYIHFDEEVTGCKVREFVKVDDLRPLPPPIEHRNEWQEREAVETRYKDCWWIGYIKRQVSHNPDIYLVYYGIGQDDLEIDAKDIRPRQVYDRPDEYHPNGSWHVARPMQNPAIWERIEVTPVVKTPSTKKAVAKTPAGKKAVAKNPLAKTSVITTIPVAKTGMKRPDVGKIQPRLRVTVSNEGDSDDSWDAKEERRLKKRPRVQSKSKSAPAKSQAPRKIIIVSPQKPLTVAHALPAINPPAKGVEQSTLVITPGSSPPLAESPFQDSAISPGSDRQARKSLANSGTSPTRSSSNSSSRSSGSSGRSNSSSSGEEEEECHEICHSEEDGPNGIFLDHSNDAKSRNRLAYHNILECFKYDSKGVLDLKRHDILTSIRAELKLTTKDVNGAHCSVFGLPLLI